MNKIHKIFNHTFAALLIALFIFLTAISSAAQTTAFTYQGRLNDNSAAANGSYDMQFRVYDTASGGTQKGLTVTKTAVAVTNGIFTVTIDPSFSAFFNQASNYLEISVRLNGSGNAYTTLTPRQLITSAPYAVQSISSQNADSLGGFPAANYLQTNGNGANLTNLNAANIASGTLGDARLSANVAFRTQANTFGGNQTVNGNLTQTGTTANFLNTNGFIVRGTLGTGAIPISGVGTRMMFYPNKSAFRIGTVDGDQWDEPNIGYQSTAIGNNSIADNDFTTAIGFGSRASGIAATAIGIGADASGNRSTALGDGTTANGPFSTAMGKNTTAGGYYSTAAGSSTKAYGDYSTALGNNTTASGNNSTATGQNTTASGNNSTAMGSYASTNDRAGSFVYGDNSTTTLVSSFLPNQFVVRASGGFSFRTSSDLSTGCNLNAGSGVFSCTSSRTVKENFVPASGSEVLSRLRLIPINYWNYIGEPGNVRHIGAFAEDFYNAFKLGTDDKSIGLLDIAGVNTAAIQALDLKVETQQQIIERQQKQIDALVKFICAANPSADACKQEKK